MKAALGTWRPDRPDYIAGRPRSIPVVEAENFILQAGRWEPVGRAAASDTATALPGNPVRSWEFELDDSRAYAFVEATDGHIYRHNGDAWDKITTDPTQTRWSMEQWEAAVYATTRGQILQKWTPPALDTDPTPVMAEVADAPSGALIVREVRSFLVLFNFGTAGVQGVWWSGHQTPDSFVEAVGFSDQQKLKAVGSIQDVLVYEDAYLICEKGIVLMSLIGGNLVWQFDTITREYGADLPGMSIAVGDSLWIASRRGFIRFGVDRSVEFIGSGAVDSEFLRLRNAEAGDAYFTYYDSGTRTIRWMFPSSKVHYPDRTLIYSMEARSWGSDNAAFPVLFSTTSGVLTWADMAQRWGPSCEEIFSILDGFGDSRLRGGVRFRFGFDSEMKPGIVTGRAARASLTTALFSPFADGKERIIVTGVRPWTDGHAALEIAAYESPQRGRTSGAFEPGDDMLDTGVIPCYRSGRYIQIRFVFDSDDPYTYINGFDVEYQREGEL